MCKLAYASNLSKLGLKRKQNLFNTAQKIMTQSDKSGYGVATKSINGDIQTKKTLNVTELITQDLSIPKFCKPISSGDLNVSKVNEVIFHARTSTNSVSIENTHPFVIGSTVLCHNGVLDYHGENYSKKTDNDTEDLTYHFDKFHLTNIDKAFTGYAAFIAFKNDSTYIVRDNTATLFYSYSNSLDCHFFGTTKNIVSELIQASGVKSKILEVDANQYIEIKDNKIVDIKSWSGLSFSSYAASKSHLSLGYSSGDYASYHNWLDEKSHRQDVSTTISSQKINSLEYVGKFSDVMKQFFGSHADVAKGIDSGDIVVKHKNNVISEADFWVLDEDSKSKLDIYWTA